jgi:NAD(P)-dependent dehydrogenase (short-subunit alcohol dehydrogenase family)
MLKNKWGRIINLTSAASLHPPGPLNSAYGTSKAALNQLTRHVSAEIAGSGVTANVIHPGDVRSDMWGDIKAQVEALGEIAKDYKAWVDWVDQTGGDDPKKAMDLVLKLISPESDSINGTFCWIDQPLQAPIPSWDAPEDARPWT